MTATAPTNASSAVAEQAGERRPRLVLREETRAEHERLDAIMDRLDLSDPNDYAAFLGVHAMVLPTIETMLEASGVDSELPDWAERRRRQPLAADLAAIDLSLPVIPVETAMVSCPARRAGVLYVLEGSRLGAAHLLRAVPEGQPAFPTAFLSHGRGSKLWPSFTPWLDAHLTDHGALERAIEGAWLAFGSYLSAARLMTANRIRTTQ